MSIREYEYYHGAAILRALGAAKHPATVIRLDNIGVGCYAIDSVGLLVKYARDRMSPWHFSFNVDHRVAVRTLQKRYEKVGVLLVCFDDSVIAIDPVQLGEVLGKAPATGSVSVSRKPRGMASVGGPAGVLPFKVADSDFSYLFDS